MSLQSFCSATRSLLLLLVIASSGCNRFTRTKQCRALIAQVNPALDEIVTVTSAGGAGGAGGASDGGGIAGAGAAAGGGAGMSAHAGPSGSAYLAAAVRYERLAKRLGPMEFASEDMAKTVAEYASMLTATAQTLRSLAAALDSNNYIQADTASRDLERLANRERAALNRIDAWCQPGG